MSASTLEMAFPGQGGEETGLRKRIGRRPFEPSPSAEVVLQILGSDAVSSRLGTTIQR